MSIGKNSIARAVGATQTAAVKKAEEKAKVVTTVQIDSITLLSKQTEENLDAMIKSVKKHGVLVPVLLAGGTDGKLWLVDGARRLAAAKAVGEGEISAVIVSVENKAAATRMAKEISELSYIPDEIREAKFKVLCVKDHDLPSYLL